MLSRFGQFFALHLLHLRYYYTVLLMSLDWLQNRISRAWFRSTDLWVMGPARFHCATLLSRITDSTFSLRQAQRLQARIVAARRCHRLAGQRVYAATSSAALCTSIFSSARWATTASSACSLSALTGGQRIALQPSQVDVATHKINRQAYARTYVMSDHQKGIEKKLHATNEASNNRKNERKTTRTIDLQRNTYDQRLLQSRFKSNTVVE